MATYMIEMHYDYMHMHSDVTLLMILLFYRLMKSLGQTDDELVRL